jgi:hypothetical protein
MTNTESKLSLDPDGDDFVLHRKAEDGTVTTMKLSATDVLTLAQSAQSLRDHILAKHSREGAEHSPVAVTPVAQVGLDDGSLGETIHLTMIGPSGSRAIFELPLQIADLLMQRLPPRLARLRTAKPTKQ